MTDTFKAQIELNASIMQLLRLGFYRNKSTGVSLSLRTVINCKELQPDNKRHRDFVTTKVGGSYPL